MVKGKNFFLIGKLCSYKCADTKDLQTLGEKYLTCSYVENNVHVLSTIVLMSCTVELTIKMSLAFILSNTLFVTF